MSISFHEAIRQYISALAAHEAISARCLSGHSPPTPPQHLPSLYLRDTFTHQSADPDQHEADTYSTQPATSGGMNFPLSTETTARSMYWISLPRQTRSLSRTSG